MGEGTYRSPNRGLQVLAAAAVALLAVGTPPVLAGNDGDGAKLSEGDPALGKQLYWEGIGADGEPVTATTTGDVRVSGAQFSCVNCHRPSGFGTTEGGYYVPPIAAPILFNDWTPNRNQNFREFFEDAESEKLREKLYLQRGRPAYDQEAVGRVVRAGLTPTGREIDRIMPRYDLDDADVANLTAYLRTLSAERSPGVEDDRIHLATIVDADADPQTRRAVLSTIELFVGWWNERMAGNRKNPGFSVPYMSTFADSFKDWELHVWELEGEPDSWGDQLAAYYEEQPVFATVSGLVEGSWDPVGAFCNEKGLPCLFPNVELPRADDGDYTYTLYFSRGLALEGEALAAAFADEDTPPERIVQYYHDGPYGHAPAEAFADALEAELPDVSLTPRRIAEAEELDLVLRALVKPGALLDALVIWPGEDIEGVIARLNEFEPQVPRIVLPARALAIAREQLSPELRERVQFTYPYEDPTAYHPRSFRVRAWMNSRRLDVTHPRLQNQTYYALTLLQYGLTQVITDYYRDYFIEYIEHLAESNLNVGTHPHLALGPGQRFASKGAFLVELDPEAQKGFRTVTDWIVP